MPDRAQHDRDQPWPFLAVSFRPMAATGDQIRRARQLAKLSQRQLAQAVGVGERSIGRIERGEAGDQPRVLAAIVDFLGLSDDPQDNDPDTTDISRLSDGQLLARRRLLDAEWERRYFAALDDLRALREDTTGGSTGPRRGLPATADLGPDPKRANRVQSNE